MNWIKTSERLPDTSDNVLAVMDGKVYVMAYFEIIHEGKSHRVWGMVYDVLDGDAYYDDEYEPTYWMPLPQLPQE